MKKLIKDIEFALYCEMTGSHQEERRLDTIKDLINEAIDKLENKIELDKKTIELRKKK